MSLSFISNWFVAPVVPKKTEIAKMEEEFVVMDFAQDELTKKISTLLSVPQTVTVTYANASLRLCNQQEGSELIRQLTLRTFGRSVTSPLTKFRDYLEHNFPQALQIAAVVNQVQDTNSLEDEKLKALNVRLIQTSPSKSVISSSNLQQVTVDGEIIDLQDKEGNRLGQYQVTRTIQVGFATREGDVTCQVTRQFSKVKPC
jgi:hypothetical protein